MNRNQIYWLRQPWIIAVHSSLTFSVGWCCALMAYTSAEAPEWSSMLGSAPAASSVDATWAPARSMQAYIRAVRPARSCAFGSAWLVRRTGDRRWHLRRVSSHEASATALMRRQSESSVVCLDFLKLHVNYINEIGSSIVAFVFWLLSRNTFYESVTNAQSSM